MRHVILTTLMTGLVSTTAAAAEAPAVGREVGQFFPRIVLPSLDGKRTLALSQFRGKKLLLIEFASW